MEKVLLDANVLLDVLFRRQRHDAVINALEDMPNAQFCLSVLSVDIIMYFVESGKQSKATAWDFLNKYEILDVTRADVEWARDNDQGDYEDAVQVACARRHNCATLVTLDQKLEGLYGKYLSVLTIR